MSEPTYKGFDRNFLLGIIGWESNTGGEIILNEMIDHSRWSVHHRLIFKFEDKYWETSYSVGATESQDESPWEYDDDVIKCKQVEPKAVQTIQYVPVTRED